MTIHNSPIIPTHHSIDTIYYQLTMPSKAALRAIEQREANAELQRSASTDYVTVSECKKIAAQKVASTKSKSSKLFSDIDASLDIIPQFSINELTLGKVLQRGKCSVVKEIIGMHCNDKGSNDNEKPQSVDDVEESFDDCKKTTSDESTTLCDMKEQKAQDKSFIAEHCLREEDGGGPRYVLKVSRRYLLQCVGPPSCKPLSHQSINIHITPQIHIHII